MEGEETCERRARGRGQQVAELAEHVAASFLRISTKQCSFSKHNTEPEERKKLFGGDSNGTYSFIVSVILRVRGHVVAGGNWRR